MKPRLCPLELGARLLPCFALVLVASCTDRPGAQPVRAQTRSAIVVQSDPDVGIFDELTVFAGTGSGLSCPSGRHILHLGSGAAYDVDVSEMFPGGSGRLAHYCRLSIVHDFGNPPPSSADLAATLSSSFFNGDTETKVGPDPYGLVLQSKPLVDLRWPAHHQRFLAWSGAIENPAGIPAPAGAAPVRLELLDDVEVPPQTSSLQLTVSDRHGYADLRIAESLLCNAGDPSLGCAAEVTARTVMQRDSTLAAGITHGSLGMLARAIFEAVQSAPHPDRLVLAMPLGWVNEDMGGSHGDIWTGNEQPAAAALHEVLQYARCHMSSIIAAAGNRGGATGSALETDFIYPARWQREPAPKSQGCLDEFGITAAGTMHEVPLVAPIGAIDRADYPVAVAREYGEPELLSYGEAVVAPSRPPGHMSSGSPRTALLYGTSPASVIGASAVALATRLGQGYTARQAEHVLATQLPHLQGPSMNLSTRLGQTRRRLTMEAAMVQVCPSCSVDRHSEANDVAEPPSMPPDATETILYDHDESCPGFPRFFPHPSSNMDVCDVLDRPSFDELPITVPQPPPVGGGNDPTLQNISAGWWLLGLVPEHDFVPELLELHDVLGNIYIVELPGGLAAGQHTEIQLFLDPNAHPIVHPATAFMVGSLSSGKTGTEPVRVEY